jgi:formamidopyrimidine-DNA glycosylase
VLRAAIRHNGTSFSDFMDSDGEPGNNQNYLMVFQREGEACYRCRAPIQRMRQGNRSSFYCTRCQD